MSIPIHPGCDKLLVSDYDGTMTDDDFFEIARRRLSDVAMPDYWREYLAGNRTHFEALQGIYSHIRGGEDEVMSIAREARLDPQLAESVAALRQRGWDIVVVSAGSTWYIERMLAEAGVTLHVISNSGRVPAGGGLLMERLGGTPFDSDEFGVDKAAVVQWALERFQDVAFAGDGRADRSPALLVARDRRFARGWLDEQFRNDGIPFRRFARWRAVAEDLLA